MSLLKNIKPGKQQQFLAICAVAVIFSVTACDPIDTVSDSDDSEGDSNTEQAIFIHKSQSNIAGNFDYSV